MARILVMPLLVFVLFSLNVSNVNAFASGACATANPNSVSDVFECVATASVNKFNNANPFTNTQRASCSQLKIVYANVLRQSGISNKDIATKLPKCAVFAQVMEDLNGEPPFWLSCLGYDGSVNHMVGCLNGMLESQSVNANKQLLSNCVMATMAYESIITMSTDNGLAPALPDNYQKIDCDQYLNSLQANVNEINEQLCAGFSGANINEHAKRCLLSDPRLTQSTTPLNCQLLRQIYQKKLIQVYGNVPPGYRLIACSVLNDIQGTIMK